MAVSRTLLLCLLFVCFAMSATVVLIATATTTTCQVVSFPASTETISYRSGQTRLFPSVTTFTAPTAIATYREPTLRAICQTARPGETITTTLPTNNLPARVKCTTDFLSGTTSVTTLTRGQVSTIFRLTTIAGEVSVIARTTLTADITSTTVRQPTTYVTCSVLPDYENPDTCHTVTAFTWATFVLTILTIQVTWWIFDVPLLWRKRDPNSNNSESGGFWIFIQSISWTCLRSHLAGTAAAIAARRGADTSEFAKIYYLGLKGGVVPPRWNTWKLCASVAADLMNIANSIMTIYLACTLSDIDAKRLASIGMWVYPTLPVSLIGLCLLAGERWIPLRATAGARSGGNWFLGILTLFVLLVVGLICSLVLWKFDKSCLGYTWWVSLLFYLFLCCPLIWAGQFLLVACAIGALVRIGAVTLAAFAHYSGGQPYCALKGPAFGIVYLVLGVLAALLAAMGVVVHRGDRRPVDRGIEFQEVRQGVTDRASSK